MNIITGLSVDAVYRLTRSVLFNSFVMVHPQRCFDELMHPICLNLCTLSTETSPI